MSTADLPVPDEALPLAEVYATAVQIVSDLDSLPKEQHTITERDALALARWVVDNRPDRQASLGKFRPVTT